ncbi:hypothetical protein IscW_ISCW007647 [Ixodes scapularis]|uniref:Uncharacterized protein n=1 Tax=Ixodes scapularis TaxID=6945 RepID=B7PUJ8_IXOSC|nr:hypothetical protein IscW_ISCW007647 [Ixodes scapularis]|eukprot:XP_002406193.1 hypothetical protein IscW_ISCW007647 [Ixodes scapularis]
MQSMSLKAYHVVKSVTEESIDLDSSYPGPVNARISDLCQELEGRHRCCKATVDVVVHGVNSILVEHGVSLNTDCLPSDCERKVHYRKAPKAGNAFLGPQRVFRTPSKSSDKLV